MPKRTDLRKILVIGSGPIVIGQAAEFDYAGTQACLALKFQPGHDHDRSLCCRPDLYGAPDTGISCKNHPL